jgi:hypothetical protein
MEANSFSASEYRTNGNGRDRTDGYKNKLPKDVCRLTCEIRYVTTNQEMYVPFGVTFVLTRKYLRKGYVELCYGFKT